MESNREHRLLWSFPNLWNMIIFASVWLQTKSPKIILSIEIDFNADAWTFKSANLKAELKSFEIFKLLPHFFSSSSFFPFVKNLFVWMYIHLNASCGYVYKSEDYNNWWKTWKVRRERFFFVLFYFSIPPPLEILSDAWSKWVCAQATN